MTNANRKLTQGEERALRQTAKGSDHGVRLSTIINLEKLGLVTYSSGMYKHETKGLFGRGNYRSRMICCWTADLTDAGRAHLEP